MENVKTCPELVSGLKIKKLLPTPYSLLPDSKGQTMIEFVLIAIISLALIFGVMDIARLSWTMLHLHGAAFAASRAEAVGRNANIAANYITMRTLGSPCVVSVRRTNITSRNPSLVFFPFRQNDLRMQAVNSTVTYYYRPLFAYGAFKAGVPVRVSSRMHREIPNPIPTSR